MNCQHEAGVQISSQPMSVMDQIFVNNTSLSIVTCPKCHRAITVYMDTGPDTEMVCPLCNQRFEFQAVIDGLPPMLKLASELDESSDELKLKEEPKKFSFDEVPAPPSPRKSTAKKRRSKSSSSSSSSGRDQSERRKKSDKKRKKAFRKSNPFRETILFVVGGLMALPVGQLIIWWAIGKDPLNLGPKISNIAAFAVPEKFHAKETPDDESNEVNVSDAEKEKELPESPLPTPKTNPDKVDIEGGGLLTPPLGEDKTQKNNESKNPKKTPNETDKNQADKDQ